MFEKTRVALVAGLVLAATLPVGAAPAAAPVSEEALIRRAFVYSFPYHEMGRLLAAQARSTAAGPARFTHRRDLATPAEHGATLPNNDILSSTVWLNLARGPVKLAVPDTQGRYYSVALVDAATDNFATIGRRTTGTRAGEFIIVGPEWASPLPQGARVIRAPGNDVLVLLRLLVDGPSDLAQARRLQDGFTLTPLQPELAPAAAAAPSAATPAASATAVPVAAASAAQPAADPTVAQRYLTLANQMLARNPPPSDERPLLQQFAAAGVCGASCSWDALPPALQARWNAMLPAMTADLERRARGEQLVNGWSRPRPATGNFGTAYDMRAEVALIQLAAPEPAEAMEMTAREDGAHRPLAGTHVYRLRLPPGAVPADASWSLAMYEKDFDGRFSLVANPIGRFSIGSRTPGVKRNRDGGIEVWVQRANPGGARASNWLPAPPGPFVLTLRTYEPRIELRDGRFAIPPVERVE